MKKYRYNTKTREIHRIDYITARCNAACIFIDYRGARAVCGNIKPSGAHWRECRGFAAWWLLTFLGYDGCAHCWPEKNKG